MLIQIINWNSRVYTIWKADLKMYIYELTQAGAKACIWKDGLVICTCMYSCKIAILYNTNTHSYLHIELREV